MIHSLNHLAHTLKIAKDELLSLAEFNLQMQQNSD